MKKIHRLFEHSDELNSSTVNLKKTYFLKKLLWFSWRFGAIREAQTPKGSIKFQHSQKFSL